MNNNEEKILNEEEASVPEEEITPSAEEANEPETDALSEMTAQRDDLLDRLQRLAAEFDNYKKRTIKERDMISETAKCNVISEFLPVLDSLTSAKSLIESATDEALKQGFELVSKQLFTALEKAGVKEIEAEGKEFNPDFHEAVMHVDDETLGAGIIVGEFRKGYTVNGKVIRPSMVKVAN